VGMPISTMPLGSRLLLVLGVALGASSCGLITFDCGGSSYRESMASGVVSDISDTVHLDGYAAAYEERGATDGSYLRQFMVGVQSVNAPIPDSIPTFLRQHVTAARLELASGTPIYRVTIPPNSAFLTGPSVLGVVANNDLSPSAFDSMRGHLLANELFIVLETDVASLQLRRTPLRVTSSYDWRKHGCQ
jgi:hypothetical protein